MKEAAIKHPQYAWESNMGYATKKHRAAIKDHGVCELHRLSFTLLPSQLELDLEMDLDLELDVEELEF